MFRQLVPQFPSRNAVLQLHPMQISRLLEEVWAATLPAPLIPGTQVPAPLILQERTSGVFPPIWGRRVGPIWDHLIYAYMIENTRVYEIFRRVLEEFALGERLDVPSIPGQQWLRTTEALFYRDNPPFQIYTMVSHVHPDVRALRRNAYFRMFGMDLNHGSDDNRPYPYVRPKATNTMFVTILERLQREVWQGIENINNFAGPNATDVAAVANLAEQLQDMLNTRRRNGNLSRAELLHVTAMSWFDITLMDGPLTAPDSPIVVDLKAEASSPDERLQKIGERVGLPSHGRSAAYIRLAASLSVLLRSIESGLFTTVATAPLLYQPGPAQQLMLAIIRDWSIATGRDMKARRVDITGREPAPVAARRPAAGPAAPTRPRPAAAPAANGRPEPEPANR
jgi:hypothetical protein